MKLSKLNKFKIQHTVSGEIAIVELENKQQFEGLSMLKSKSEDKSTEAILAVMSFLLGRMSETESSITVASSLGKLTFEKAE